MTSPTPDDGPSEGPTRKRSSADVRREEILDAVERCVGEFGIEGTTLQRIADEAGITRSNLAYFIGSRDEIVDAAFGRSIGKFVDDMKARVAGLAPPERLPAFIDSLLAGSEDVSRNAAVLNALSATAEHDEHARTVLSEGLRDVDAWVSEMVDDRYPEATEDLRRAVSDALPLILRGFDRERRLEHELADDRRRRSLARAAETLLDALGPPVTVDPSEQPDHL